jgi:hypothetical protein
MMRKWRAWLHCVLFVAAVIALFRYLLNQPDTVQAAQDQLAAEWVPSIRSFNDGRLQWHNGEPGGTSAVSGAEKWAVEGEELVIVPAPQRDYWSKTFYSPLLVKHDAQTLLTVVPATVEATLTTAFTLTPVAQFDQAGIMILVDDTTWVKAGIGEQLRIPASPYSTCQLFVNLPREAVSPHAGSQQ